MTLDTTVHFPVLIDQTQSQYKTRNHCCKTVQNPDQRRSRCDLLPLIFTILHLDFNPPILRLTQPCSPFFCPFIKHFRPATLRYFFKPTSAIAHNERPGQNWFERLHFDCSSTSGHATVYYTDPHDLWKY